VYVVAVCNWLGAVEHIVGLQREISGAWDSDILLFSQVLNVLVVTADNKLSA
jgi:hypothetical protein